MLKHGGGNFVQVLAGDFVFGKFVDHLFVEPGLLLQPLANLRAIKNSITRDKRQKMITILPALNPILSTQEQQEQQEHEERKEREEREENQQRREEQREKNQQRR